MTAVFLDTHAWAWSLEGNSRLSPRAARLIEEAETVLISPVSIFEIAQKVRLRKWREMVPFVNTLLDVVSQQGAEIARLEPAICLEAGTLHWDHRDPFDRLLAATALHYRLPIVSADPVFDGIVKRIW